MTGRLGVWFMRVLAHLPLATCSLRDLAGACGAFAGPEALLASEQS